MPITYSCVICGIRIDSYARPPTWLSQFRAAYSTSEGTFISGVGRYIDRNIGDFIVPWNPNVRWDDPDFDSQPHGQIPVMKQRPQNGRHGFVLHDSCWRLLQKFFEPADVPIERLLSICKSLPFPLGGLGVYWGHTYGGLITFDDENYYPWEDWITEIPNFSGKNPRMDPYDVAEIPDIIRQSSQSPCSSNRSNRVETAPAAGGNDCFTILPWEIVEAIATNLLVPDMLSLVRASKYFLPIMTSRAFWASRFQPGNDRDFLFEKRNSRETRDWAMLYQHTNRASSPPGLMNRRRIWGLIQEFAALSRLRIGEDPGLSASELSICGGEWHEVAGDIEQSRRSFYTGGHLFHKQSTTIPQSLFGIAFSLIGKSITGMHLISKNHADISLGYINKREQHFLEVSGISGFILAISDRGVQAVRVIDNNGHVSKWVGIPTDAPVTERLVAPGAVTALSVGSDGYKVVSVAATWPRPVVPDTSLRAKAMWYPSVPSQELYLNDESFMGENPLAAGYRPVAWIHFGGPKGINLPSITGIYVTRWYWLRTIEFEYDSENIPLEQRKVGRCETDGALSGATRFPIDGRGGEFINSIAVSIIRGKSYYGNMPYQIGQLESFKVTTNHARSAHFKPKDVLVDESALVPLSIEPGTTLTGLCATQHHSYGLLGLGPISEVLSQ